MTLHEFSNDVVPVIQLIISIVGVTSIVLAWYQFRLSHKWNKLNAQHKMLANWPALELETSVWEIYQRIKCQNGNIPIMTAKNMCEDNTKELVEIKTFLNKFEHICAAINVRSFDEDYAFSVHSARITNVYTRFSGFIQGAREFFNDSEIYIEIEKTAVKWMIKKEENETQYKKEAEALNKKVVELERIKREALAKKGAQAKVP